MIYSCFNLYFLIDSEIEQQAFFSLFFSVPALNLLAIVDSLSLKSSLSLASSWPWFYTSGHSASLHPCLLLLHLAFNIDVTQCLVLVMSLHLPQTALSIYILSPDNPIGIIYILMTLTLHPTPLLLL